MENKLVPVTLLTGYLGAGKTTLLNQVLTNQKGYKVAVIVNDIGEVNIDASLIAKGGQVTQKDENLVPLQNGCICCTLKVDLINQIIDLIKTGRFDYILIEASGICEPIPIAQSITMLDGSYDKRAKIARLDNIVSVVDVARMADEFGCGENLVKEDIDEEDIENLLIQQIEFCNTIILNKVDTVSKEQLEKVKAIIRTLQPKAVMFETNYGQIDVDEILNTKQKTVRKKKHPWIGDLIFYILLFGMVIGALILKDIHKDIPKSIAGISIFTVLTSSMENEIPKGSLVVAKYMEPSELKIGDDITFMISETTTITHRIIGIVENYEQTGQRAFETKGTMNKDKDKLPVPAVNVIGKVVYHNYTLGRITDFISQNIIIILVMVVLIWVLSYVLKSIFKKI